MPRAILSPEKRADSLIATYIEPHPGSTGIAEYRLRVEENGYPVWQGNRI